MATYTELALGVAVHTGDEDSNSVVVNGVRTESGGQPNFFSYSYGVYDIGLMGGDDVVYLTNITANDPNGINPRGRQNVDGGAGNDYLYVSSLTAATLTGGDGDDVLWKVDLRSQSSMAGENGVISGGVGYRGTPDGIYQDWNWTDFDIFDAGAGNDTITTGNGPDWVYAGSGNDTVSVGSGDNVVFAGDGADVILAEGLYFSYYTGGSLAFNSLIVTVAFGSNTIWAGEGDDTVTISNIRASGTGAVVNGEGGNDTITVQALTASWITGGDGNDTITIRDTVTGSSAYTGASFSAYADTVWGENGDDVIYTGRGNDLIVGGAGHDWLFGGHGDDGHYGGAGGATDDGASDRFSFGSNYQYQFLSFGEQRYVDTIYDFQPASRYGDATGKSDKIDLAGLISDSEYLTYDAGNPFLQDELRLVSHADGTEVQANHGGEWVGFLMLYGVDIGELDTTTQADLSGGLAAAGGGDFLWYTG